jgi:hypothetical protein
MIRVSTFKMIGWLLVIGMAITMLQSVHLFLVEAQVAPVDWFFFNSCFFTKAVFGIGFLLSSPLIMAAMIPFLAYYGGRSLLYTGWQYPLFQIGHILMLSGIAYTLWGMTKFGTGKQTLLGFVCGAIGLGLFISIQDRYITAHPVAKLKIEQVFGAK